MSQGELWKILRAGSHFTPTEPIVFIGDTAMPLIPNDLPIASCEFASQFTQFQPSHRPSASPAFSSATSETAAPCRQQFVLGCLRAVAGLPALGRRKPSARTDKADT